MAVSTSRLAFSDCFDLMEKAINSPRGIQIKFASYDDAFNFRLRLHSARKIDRKDNLELYEDTHPLYGRSPYDVLTGRIRQNSSGWWLRLERVDTREFEIQEIGEPEPEPQLALLPPKQVEILVVPIKPKPKLLRRL